MKNRFILLTVLGILISTLSQSQNDKINANNYYDFYTRTLNKTSWLKRDEIVPIIIEELDKYNFKHNCTYQLYELYDTLNIILDVYSTEKKIGFIYKTGYSITPDINHKRDLKYSQCKYNYKGSFSCKEFEIPQNIYLLYADDYWYQYNSNKEEINDFVCRNKIIEILRSDIRNILGQHTNLDSALEEKKWIAITPDMESFKKRFPNIKETQGFNSQAKFYNGKDGLYKYIQDSLKYPIDALRKKIEGKVIVEYTVNKNGEIENPIILESSNEIFNNEAIRVISHMPKWKPALTGKNEEISMLYKIQINFSLNNNFK